MLPHCGCVPPPPALLRVDAKLVLEGVVPHQLHVLPTLHTHTAGQSACLSAQQPAHASGVLHRDDHVTHSIAWRRISFIHMQSPADGSQTCTTPFVTGYWMSKCCLFSAHSLPTYKSCIKKGVELVVELGNFCLAQAHQFHMCCRCCVACGTSAQDAGS